MVTAHTILNQLTINELYESLIQVLSKECEDFSAIRKEYERTMAIFQTELGEHTIPSVNDTMEAIHQQVVSNLLFSGALGLKANLDNFFDPLSRNFLDVDSDVYLRESTARRLPAYEQAHRVLDQFYACLSPDQQILYEDIHSYINYLETMGPKLAHYYGYLLGNELLHWIIPGYHADTALTVQYHMMLRAFFGKEYSFLAI